MSEHETFELKHKDDFGQVYNLDDPRPYFQGLRPGDYRMPGVAAEWLRAKAPVIAAARGRPDELRLLDFACGYGAIGALLRHRTSMRDLYGHYATGWRRSDGRANWSRDRDAFVQLRREERLYEIGGLDIAPIAVEYACHMGFIDAGFSEDLSVTPPGMALRRFLSGTDIVVECGALGPLLTGAVEHMVHATRDSSRPWFLYCPRPDVDWRPLHDLWAEAGYEASACVRAPVRYRKALSEHERDQMLTVSAQFGYRPEDVMESGYLLVEMTLARPGEDCRRTKSEDLLLRDGAR